MVHLNRGGGSVGGLKGDTQMSELMSMMKMRGSLGDSAWTMTKRMRLVVQVATTPESSVVKRKRGEMAEQHQAHHEVLMGLVHPKLVLIRDW